MLSGNNSSAVHGLSRMCWLTVCRTSWSIMAPVRRDAVGQRVGAGQLHDPRVHPVGGAGVGDAARAQPRDVPVLGLRVRGEQVRRQPRVRGQQRILHHHQVVDGVEAVLAQGIVCGLLGVRQQRHHVRPLARDADPGGQFPGGHHVRHVLAGRDGHDVGRRLVFRHVLVAGQHPGHAVEVDAVLIGQDAAGPDAGGDRVAAVDARPLAFQFLRLDRPGGRGRG